MSDSPNSVESPDLEIGDVYRVERGGRTFVLVGTAHISRESVDLVREVIEAEEPDCVCVELDDQRYAALEKGGQWDSLDLRQVIREGQLATLLVNILLGSYQKRLGGKLGVAPGSEMIAAVRTAEEKDIPFELCDRNIRVTLRRAWYSLAWYRKFSMLVSLLAGAFDKEGISEDELRRLRSADVMSEVLSELGAAMPMLKKALIDERDEYLAQRIRDSRGAKIVAVVGAGHVAGMRSQLESGATVDLERLDEIPPVSKVWKVVGWAIPVAVVAGLVSIAITKGPEAAGENAMFWVLVNSIPTAFGCLLALGHPATIAAAFVVAPFTSMTPLIGAGYVAAFTQTWFVPPRVHEFHSVADDVAQPSAWWRSRLLRVFLVFLLSSLLGAAGTWIGGVRIVSNVFAAAASTSFSAFG